MNNEQNEKVRDFIEYILNLTPNEIGIITSALGVLLSQNLSPMQQNVVGNFFELVGQVILMISAQGQYINTTNEDDYSPKVINNCLPKKRR
ncbi:MAG: hypothetical protein J1F31_05105 [Erysipelotrichales bacterium]|nr:hypothetical protein [Erysipelotrichales bacterium]